MNHFEIERTMFFRDPDTGNYIRVDKDNAAETKPEDCYPEESDAGEPTYFIEAKKGEEDRILQACFEAMDNNEPDYDYDETY